MYCFHCSHELLALHAKQFNGRMTGSAAHTQAGSQWIKLNPGHTGVYRVNYPKAMWAQLAKASNASLSAIGPADLAGLMDDAFALSQAGASSIETFLDLTR